jgi:galactokinase
VTQSTPTAAGGTPEAIEAFAPGRVNLIGGHTDYTGGVVISMAIELGTTFSIAVDEAADSLVVTSADEPGVVTIATGGEAGELADHADEPVWGRIVRAAAGSVGAGTGMGGRANIATTLPIGSGLSSSTALSVATALAFGLEVDSADATVRAAKLCRNAEEAASGVPSGLMDQLASLGGRVGHGLLIDCTTFAIEPIPLPDDAVFVVAHCGEPRRLATSAYARRRAECEAAQEVIGPLPMARPADAALIADPVLRRRARHVISENERVRASADVLRSGDLAEFGRLMNDSHASLAGDFEVSTPALEGLVEALRATPGVLGARITGAGFGGCVVAVAERRAEIPDPFPYRYWVVRASGGAWRHSSGRRYSPPS